MSDPILKQQLPSRNGEESMKDQPTQFKSRKIIVFATLFGILLVIFSINRHQENSNVGQDNLKNLIERWRDGNRADDNTDRRFSMGEKILIGADDNPDKQLAADKFAAAKFHEAKIGFTNSLKVNPNDPEALIYLNNSLAAIDGNTVNIGVSVPIGGSLNVTKEILRGVAQAQNEINKQGGIEQDGVKKMLQVQIANDDNQPEVAAQIAAKFVEDSEIMAVIGHNSSSASLAAAPIYQQGNLVMVSPTSVARELSQAGDYIFRTTPSTRVLAETLAQYAVDNIRRQEITVCADSTSPASTSFKDEFSLALFELGGETSNVNCDFGSEDFNPDEVPSKAIANGSEALLLIPSVDRINQALDVSRANQKRLTVLGNHSMYTYETLKIGQSDLNGMVIPTAWHPNSTADSAFNENARELWGMEGSWRTATAYDATKAIASGLNSAATRPQLQQALANSGFTTPGVLGEIRFQRSGDRQVLGTLVKIRPGESSGTGFDFKPIEQKRSPDFQSQLENSQPQSKSDGQR